MIEAIFIHQSVTMRAKGATWLTFTRCCVRNIPRRAVLVKIFVNEQELSVNEMSTVARAYEQTRGSDPTQCARGKVFLKHFFTNKISAS